MSKQNILPGNKIAEEDNEGVEGVEQKIKVCICKREILDTVELMLKVCDKHEGSRPKM